MLLIMLSRVNRIWVEGHHPWRSQSFSPTVSFRIFYLFCGENRLLIVLLSFYNWNLLLLRLLLLHHSRLLSFI